VNFEPTSLADRLAFQHPDLVHVLMELDIQHRRWRDADPTFPPLTITCLDRDKDQNAGVGGKGKSWHLFMCAADIRSRHYTALQAARVMDWLKEKCPQPMWELVLIPHGTGPHFHIATRAWDWRKAKQ
jgi:hypothetical protein